MCVTSLSPKSRGRRECCCCCACCEEERDREIIHPQDMVVLEHMGFGARDREVWLYFWDLRDGPDFNGWWITPDFVGNNDFFFSSNEDAPTPVDCKLGSWRSPNVEQIQLKRKLEIGFSKSENGSLVAIGGDAGTAIIPDGACKVDLSKMEFVEQGLNHGRPCYIAKERTRPAATSKPVAETSDGASNSTHTYATLALGIAVGMLAMLAVQRAL